MKYNVNDLGYYNGGVPRANRGSLRGTSIGEPGAFHSPQLHNFMHFNHVDSKRVTSEDTIQFKHFMTSDRADFERTMPGYPMYYDKDFNYRKDRDFWLKLLLGMSLFSYVYKRYHIEVDRVRMAARMEGYKNMPGHHFHNRGGVVVLKQFTGFEKYYQNSEGLNTWFKKAYPG